MTTTTSRSRATHASRSPRTAPGAPHKQDTASAHGSPLGEEEVRLTKEAYGYPSLEPFFVPDEALEHFRLAIDRGKERQAEWEERFAAYRHAHPDDAADLQRLFEGRLPDGFAQAEP